MVGGVLTVDEFVDWRSLGLVSLFGAGLLLWRGIKN